MPGFDGTGPMGMGPMTGWGRGYCAMLLPRSSTAFTAGIAYKPYLGRWVAPYYGIPSFAPRMPREQELEFLKSEAQALREELKELENRIAQLSAEKE
jgi:hypothetical protein